MISIIIPCFNQGRFLIDCLESVVVQTVPPGEVVVVNDGSTDEETNELCSRLGGYAYPFPLCVVVQENRGLPAARNRGVRETRGDIVLPLDSDDLLFPAAVEEYERFFASHPGVDVCYPDVMHHGNFHWNYQAPLYNPWRHTQHNWFVPCTAVRRRVFEAGYRFCEDMRRGYEDWEFWLRTCALGPFRASPLKKQVFAYRKWGYSMLSATNHDEQLADIRRRHQALKIWSPRVESDLRNRHAPSHCWFRADPRPVGPGCRDLVCYPLHELERGLKDNYVSRFVWFGDLGSGEPPAVQFLVGNLAATRHAPLYVLFKDGAVAPYLYVLDRLAVLEAQNAAFYETPPSAKAVLVRTRGERYAWPVSVQDEACWAIPEEGPLAPFLHLPSRTIFPGGHAEDLRLAEDMYYYYRREFLAPSFPHPEDGRRVLVVALSELSHGPAARSLHLLLGQKALRRRFDEVYLLTLAAGEHPAHPQFEAVVDGIYHFGAFDSPAVGQALQPDTPASQAGELGCQAGEPDLRRRDGLVRQLLEAASASDLLIVDSVPGLGLIPHLREARLPLRITALLPAGAGAGPRPPGKDTALYVLASQYAALVDRAAAEDEESAWWLMNLLFFPRAKLRTFGPAAGDRWAEEAVSWLFPADGTPRDHRAEVFGLSAAGRNPRAA
jgi:hypothetical protein